MTPEITKIAKNRAFKKLTHEVFIHKSKHREAKHWCEEHLGKKWDLLDNPEGMWSMFWGPAQKDSNWQSHYRFCFEKEADAIWFSLRWQ